MTRPKIAVFLPSLVGGGAERNMVNLCRGFVAKGYPTDLVVAKAEGEFLRQLPESVRLVDLASPRVASSIPALARYLRLGRPATLLTGLDHANIAALLARRLARVPTRVVVSVHNRLSIELKQLGTKARLGLTLGMRGLYPRAEAVVAVSRGVAEDVLALAPGAASRLRVIYNPIDIERAEAQMRATVSHPWFAPGGPPVVVALGRLTRQKSFADLIQAFALVVRSAPARLVIFGEGEERAMLEALVRSLGLSESVSLPGFADNPFAYLARARLVVMSSIFEGFGNVLVEAMAVGTPVISTDCQSGPREILEDGRLGALVPVGDVDAMARAITEALRSTPEPERYRHRARDFALPRITDEYLAVMGLAAGEAGEPAGHRQ